MILEKAGLLPQHPHVRVL